MAHLDIVRSMPAAFRYIRLALAREPAHPAGDPRISYLLVAPLDGEGRLDAAIARDFYGACGVLRMRPGEEPLEGAIVQAPNGAWMFHYESADGAEDDDPTYRLGAHRFIPGEYVTIFENDGEHRVVSVDPL